MMKRIVLGLALALALAAPMSVASAPAEAGPFRDKLRMAAKKIIIKGGCIGDRILGQSNSILCN